MEERHSWSDITEEQQQQELQQAADEVYQEEHRWPEDLGDGEQWTSVPHAEAAETLAAERVWWQDGVDKLAEVHRTLSEAYGADSRFAREAAAALEDARESLLEAETVDMPLRQRLPWQPKGHDVEEHHSAGVIESASPTDFLSYADQLERGNLALSALEMASLMRTAARHIDELEERVQNTMDVQPTTSVEVGCDAWPTYAHVLPRPAAVGIVGTQC